MQEEGAQTWPFDRAVEIALQLVPTTDATRRERATRYVDWAADHTGILRFQEASDDQEQIRFWHRLFREYLSANRLAQEDTTAGDKIDKLWKDGRLSDPFWEDVIRLLPRTLGTIEKARSLRERLENLAASNSPQRGRILGLSAAGIIENRDLFPDVSFHDLARSMARIYEEEGNNWTLSDRLLFLDAVGRLDTTDCDPRMHVEKWVELKSGGAFVIHHRELPKSVSFAYAWAPVTVHEYWKFVKSDAFSDSAVWKDAPDSVSKSMASLSSHIQGQMRHPNRPVTWVSLYGALAFCAWKTMGRSDGRFIRLPQTAEWRKLLTASQIDRELLDAKEWPSGEKALFNWRGAGIGYPTPVGAFPLKVSGATDVLGNVWEWLSPSKGEPYHTFDDHQNRSESFPVGGGAYNTSLNPPDKSIAVPPPEFTTNGYEAIGFRCVISDVELDLKAVLSRLRADRRPRAERK